MAIVDQIRAGVAKIDAKTKSLQCDITLEQWENQDGKGKPTFGSPVVYKALVDLTRKQKLTSSGKLVMTMATLTFLVPVTPNGATTRLEPIDPRDRITLPDGKTAPIVEVTAFEDAGLLVPFFNSVTLGTIIRGE